MCVSERDLDEFALRLDAYVQRFVAAERERCAKIAEDFDDFAYRGRKIDGYSKGTYMMIDGQESMDALAARIRSGE